MTSDDMYSLECWLRDKALEAHKKAQFKKLSMHSRLFIAMRLLITAVDIEQSIRDIHYGEEIAFEEVIDHIKNRHISQRPHIRITEEFDGGR